MAADENESQLPPHLRAALGSAAEGSARSTIDRVTRRSMDKLSTGRFGRAAKLGRLAWAGGRAVIADKARGVMGGQTSSGTGLAAEMLKTFAEMRGISMKLGQMLSYLDDALPPEARKVLSVLQRDVSPMSWDAIQPHLEAELGCRVSEVFSEVDPRAIAAASIGQVHRGVTKEGVEVAIKVQYPGMAEAMRADLDNAKILSLLQRSFSFATDTKAITEELQARFMDECDYRKEAEYQEAYRQRFAAHPVIVVPEVHHDLSSERVLVTSFHRGRGYHEWLASDPGAAELDRAARTFYRFYLGAFYMDGLFNCDPHPGNYLFREDGRIVFLDYGCCRRFPPERLERWIELCKVICADDEAGIQRLGQELGFVEPGAYDEAAFRDLMRYLYTPYLTDTPFDFSDYRPRETFRRMFLDNANLFKLNMPADTVFLNRINFGLVSLIAEMNGVINVRSTVDAYFRGEDPDWPEDPFRGQRYAARGPRSCA